MLISVVAGLIIDGIFMFAVKNKYNLNVKTYNYNLSQNTDVVLTESIDEYFDTTIVRRRIPKPTSSSGGSRGSGSGMHFGSSGTSHGGGGRSF